jgi:Cytidylyltransferase-like
LHADADDSTASEERIPAIYPGSFDPFTNGHLDLVERRRAKLGRALDGLMALVQSRAGSVDSLYQK